MIKPERGDLVVLNTHRPGLFQYLWKREGEASSPSRLVIEGELCIVIDTDPHWNEVQYCVVSSIGEVGWVGGGVVMTVVAAAKEAQ